MKNELVELIPTTSHCTLHSKRNDQQNKKAAYENRKGLWKPYVCVGVDIVVVQLFSCSFMSYILQCHGLQQFRLSYPSPSPGACSNSYALSWWCHPTILSSVIPFSSCLQSFPASGALPMSWLFTSGVPSIGASASVSVSPVNIQGWFPLGLMGLISLLSKGLSRIFSSTTIWKHQFFSIQPSSWSNSHIHTWLLGKKHSFDYTDR